MFPIHSINRIHGGAGIGAVPIAPAIGFGAVGAGAVPTGAVPAVSNPGSLNPAIFTPFHTTPTTLVTQNPYYHPNFHYSNYGQYMYPAYPNYYMNNILPYY